jgi:filamentous hemagglutinin family protein
VITEDLLKCTLLKLALFAAYAAVWGSALANPQFGKIISGSVSITQQPDLTTVNQTSKQAIINWQSFNIASPQTTHFQQPAGGVTLNQINPMQGVSQIYGRLTATGQIILINPAGIYFGPNAYVNVGGLIASTAGISNANFKQGNYQFTSIPGFNGAIINAGTIIAINHGLLALIGGAVRNDGMIEANLGHVVLAAGDSFAITLAGNDLIAFNINSPVTKRAQDKDGNTMADGVSNTGKILARGGHVLITADAAAGLLDHAINIQGIVFATSVHRTQGDIILSASPASGVVRVAAYLNASGQKSGMSGGNVTITGNDILLEAPTMINVSGDNGAGTVFIGGNYQGKGPLMNADGVVMQPGATIQANAGTHGNGGTVIIWSNQFTNVNGNINARGGSISGNGGLVETSSHEVLSVGDFNVDTSAAHGQPGTWLLDPSDLTISVAANANVTAANPFAPSSQTSNSTLNISTLLAALAAGNVTIQTSAGAGPGNGDIFVTTPITWSSGNSLLLSAYRNISATASITDTGGGNVILRADNTGTGAGTVSFSTGNNVTVSGSGVVTIYYNPVVFGTQDTIYTGGSTPTQYMLVNNATNLQNINSFLIGNFALGTDIVLSGNFTPIGTTTTPYTGQFDGLNNIISHLNINNTTPNISLGLFGAISATAIIQNVTLNNATISEATDNSGTSIYIGSLVGLNNGGTIINSSVMNPIITASGTNYGISGSRGYYDIGGLIGASFGGTISQSASTDGSITNYVNTNANAANLTAFNEVGGFLGGEHSSATLSNDDSTTAVTSLGNVTVTGAGATGELLVGGFLGRLDQTSTAAEIYSTGSVQVTTTLSVPSTSGGGYVLVGGLIGVTSIANSPSVSPPPVVTNAYSTSAVTVNGTFVNSTPDDAEILVGGLMGQSNGVLTNSYSTGAVTATLTSDVTSSNEVFYIGGLSGNNYTIIDNSYSSSPVTVTGNNYGNDVEVSGFVGANITLFDKEITGSSSSGLVNVAVNNYAGGQLYIGGFAGSNVYYGDPPPSRLPFDNDYSISILNVSGQNNASTTVIGGFVGGNGKDPADAGGNIINSYSTGYINNNVTTVNGGVTTAGGFLGQNIASSDPNAEPITLASNFYDTGTTGFNQNQGVGNEPGAVTGVTPGCFNGGACPNGGTADLSSQATYSAAGWNFLTTWGIINSASYPYLLGANPLPPQIISGSTPAPGGTGINLVTNGNIIATTLTGPNGFFYFYEPNDTIASNALGLVYLTGSNIKGNAIFAPAPDGNSSGVSLAANTIQVGSNSTLTIANNNLSALINGLSDANLLYSATGSTITIGTLTNPTVNLFTTSTTTYLLSGVMNNIAGGAGTITFNGPVSVTAATSINSQAITFANTVAGSANLTLASNHTTTFANAVTLGSLEVTASTIDINTGSISTAGAQTYNSPVVLGVNTNLAGSNITFNNGISGGTNLTVSGQAGNNNIVFIGNINLNVVNVSGSNNGNNTLNVNVNSPETWNILATNSGNLLGIPGLGSSFAFSNFPNLTGGDDGNTFNFTNGINITGTLDGVNLAKTNTLNLSAYTSYFIATMSNNLFNGIVTHQNISAIAAYNNITNIIGNNISLLKLPDQPNKLTLTSYNSGYVSDPFYFNQFDMFTSQSRQDTVNFVAPGIYVLSTGQTTVNGQAIQLNGFSYQLFTGNITIAGFTPIPPSPYVIPANAIAAVIIGGTPGTANQLGINAALAENSMANYINILDVKDLCQVNSGFIKVNNIDIPVSGTSCSPSKMINYLK